ncbi:hypothetical protein [Halorubellus litoreus]|uniref:DUF2283 domain-containing protein n=1 Tax=Halorubellus litoreus TaxID=755308 RepID=A0ABD5VDZ7_9EURY
MIDTCNFSQEATIDVLVRDHDRELYIDVNERGGRIHVRLFDGDDNTISVADLELPGDEQLGEAN